MCLNMWFILRSFGCWREGIIYLWWKLCRLTQFILIRGFHQIQHKSNSKNTFASGPWVEDDREITPSMCVIHKSPHLIKNFTLPRLFIHAWKYHQEHLQRFLCLIFLKPQQIGHYAPHVIEVLWTELGGGVTPSYINACTCAHDLFIGRLFTLEKRL